MNTQEKIQAILEQNYNVPYIWGKTGLSCSTIYRAMHGKATPRTEAAINRLWDEFVSEDEYLAECGRFGYDVLDRS